MEVFLCTGIKGCHWDKFYSENQCRRKSRELPFPSLWIGNRVVTPSEVKGFSYNQQLEMPSRRGSSFLWSCVKYHYTLSTPELPSLAQNSSLKNKSICRSDRCHWISNTEMQDVQSWTPYFYTLPRSSHNHPPSQYTTSFLLVSLVNAIRALHSKSYLSENSNNSPCKIQSESTYFFRNPSPALLPWSKPPALPRLCK